MNNFERFYQLHHQAKPFILGNVWNVKSAKIVEASGFEAMATSSGAISDSLGYKDGEQIPFDELLYVIRRIRSGTSIPLSVDFERGYTDDLTLLNEYIQQLIDAGVVGINLEDAQGEGIYLRKLSSIKNYLTKTNQQLFINARTDGFLQKLPSPLETTLERARLYQDAGADGLFVTGVKDTQVIKEIVRSTSLPVNIVSVPGLPVAALAECGVKRISMAVLLYKATYSKMEAMVKAVLNGESLEPLF
jgi:2-methylisocitrate lyase-like PEP mutase family enzyme